MAKLNKINAIVTRIALPEKVIIFCREDKSRAYRFTDARDLRLRRARKRYWKQKKARMMVDYVNG